MVLLSLMNNLGGRNEQRIFNPAGKKGCGTFVAVCFAGCVVASLSCLGHGGSVSVAILCSLSYLWDDYLLVEFAKYYLWLINYEMLHVAWLRCLFTLGCGAASLLRWVLRSLDFTIRAVLDLVRFSCRTRSDTFSIYELQSPWIKDFTQIKINFTSFITKLQSLRPDKKC